MAVETRQEALLQLLLEGPGLTMAQKEVASYGSGRQRRVLQCV
jgi:hypothetical protein